MISESFEKRERQDEEIQKEPGSSIDELEAKINELNNKIEGAPKAPMRPDEVRESQFEMAREIGIEQEFKEDEIPANRVAKASSGLFEIYSESKEREKFQANTNFDRSRGDGGEPSGVDASDMEQIKKHGQDYDFLRNLLS